MLSLAHPAVHISSFVKDRNVAEIFTIKEFSETLTGKKFWTLDILHGFIKDKNFLKSANRDRKILIDLLHIEEVQEISFRRNILSVRVSSSEKWNEVLPQIDEIMKEYQIKLRYR